MARPVVSAAAEELYGYLGALTNDDEATGWQLLLYCDSLASMVEPLYDWVSDTDEFPGWTSPFNVDEAPVEVLPWLAQFVGVALLQGLTEEQAREAIAAHLGFNRGTPAAIVAATQRYLVGARRVRFQERFAYGAANPYGLWIRVYTPDTPDGSLVLKSILEQKPAGILLDFDVADGQTYTDLNAAFASFNAVNAAYGSFEEVRTDIP